VFDYTAWALGGGNSADRNNPSSPSSAAENHANDSTAGGDQQHRGKWNFYHSLFFSI
jgi:hypothetical protein